MRTPTSALAAALLLPAALAAQSPPAGGAATGADPRTHALIVAGAGGEPAYVRRFTEWGGALRDALALRLGDGAHIVLLAEKPEMDRARIAGPSARERVLRELAALTSVVRPGDQLLIVLIGHGTPGPENPRLNLPGPDLSASDLSLALSPFAGNLVAVVNAASASGDFVRPLSAPNRVIVTATKSGYERNETRFARFLVDAVSGAAGDTDKDGRLSLLELFEYVRRETARSYEEETRLLTEHALLEDDGDGQGTAKPDPAAGGDGRLARSMTLNPAPAGTVAAGAAPRDAAMAALVQTRDSLERELQALQGRRASMPAAAYDRALEEIMLGIARASRAIRDAEGAKP